MYNKIMDNKIIEPLNKNIEIEENKFTEKDYLEAQYKIQRSIQANVATIAFIVVAQFLLTIISLVIIYSSLSALPSIFVKK